MKVTFWGTATSTGVPVVGCSCEVCQSPDPKNHRRRASVLLEEGSQHWLIDAGPDFRRQALDARIATLDAVLLTHAHADHILGLDDLRPLSWRRPIPIWSDEKTQATVRNMFPYFFGEGDGKTSRPKLAFHTIEPGTAFDAAGLPVLPLSVRHGDSTILGYRVRDFAYLTDCNGIPEETRPFLAGLEVLVLDALRPTPHPTHFSLEEAIETARSLGAERTWFTHFSHDVEYQKCSQTLPPGMSLAYDGLQLELR